jgi:hypothetical protein
MPWLRHRTPRTVEGGAPDAAIVALLVQQALGPAYVPDPVRLSDLEEAASVDLPSVVEMLTGRPEVLWPELVRQYYEVNGDTVRAGIDLERRVTSLASAEPYLEEWWHAAVGPPSGVPTVEGLVPGSVRMLILHDAATIRVVRASTLSRLAANFSEMLELVRARVVKDGPFVSRLDPSSAFFRIDLGDHFWSASVIEALDVIALEAVGSLGTLVATFGPHVVVARPVDVDVPVRSDFGSLVVEQWKAHTADPSLPTAAPVWRRGVDGRVFPIEVEAGEGRIHLTDERFRGILMAAEPTVLLLVPEWLSGILDDRQYTRFAALIAASSTPSPRPEDIADAEGPQLTMLARVCSAAVPAAWPRIIAFNARIGQIRTGVGRPPSTLGTSIEAGEIRVEISPLLDALASSAMAMPGLRALGAYGARGLRVGDSTATEETELGLIVPDLPGDGWEPYRLWADCGSHLPAGWSAHLEAIPFEDQRWSDEAHMVRLK